MIVNENITTYLHSLEPDGPEWLEQMRCHAEEEQVPIIRREMEPFLRTILTIHKPGKVLEIGTGIGYSALFLDSCMEGLSITTIENYEPRLREAREYLKNHGNITLLEGDAGQIIKELSGHFDLVFLDAAKGQYLAMLPDLLRLMSPGAVLLADNVLQEGELIRSRYVTPRRQRTIHSRMREFLWEVKHHPQLVTSVLTIGDGVVMSVKTEPVNEKKLCEGSREEQHHI